MHRYVARRLLQALPLLLAISLIAFLLLHAIPGGPLAAYKGTSTVTEKDLDRLREQLGLNRPLVVQYVSWLGSFVRGDWGVSYVARRPVTGLVLERLPASLSLMASALVLSLVVSVPLGVFAAIRRNSWVDHALTFVSFVGLSLPVFWLGLLLIIVFTVWLGWLPGGGVGPPGVTPDLFTRLRYLLLPTIALSLGSIGFFTRYLRASMIEVLHTDHMRFTRARGVPPTSRYLKHGMRNASIPFVTVVALHIPDYLIGTVAVETIYSWPGTGRLFWESAMRFDYPVLMGILVIGSFVVVLSNLAADVMYALLDPRVRYD